MKINYFGVGTDLSDDRVTRGTMRDTHLTLVKLKRKEKRKKREKRRDGEERRERGKRGATFSLRFTEIG